MLITAPGQEEINDNLGTSLDLVYDNDMLNVTNIIASMR